MFARKPQDGSHNLRESMSFIGHPRRRKIAGNR
jgi:hypothetical protein